MGGRELGTEGAPDAPTPEGALQESGARRIQEQIAGRVAALEEKMNDQELAIRELRASHGSKNDPDAVVARMKEEFGKLEHVIQVHYDILGDGTWHIVAVHDLYDGSKALDTICEKSIKIQDEFDDLYVVPIVLHKDQVLPGYTARTKPILTKDESG